MGKITPHLWFDEEARGAAEFYILLFPNSRIISSATIRGTSFGNYDITSFELRGAPFMATNASTLCRPNPSISFFLNFDTSKDEHALDSLEWTWARLAEGGTERVPLHSYHFSERYGWVEDRFGISWQLMLTTAVEQPFIMPALQFANSNSGRAEEAIDFYCSIFADTGSRTLMHYPSDMGSEKAGKLMHGDFIIASSRLTAMDSVQPYDFTFNEAISLLIPCEVQKEIDYCWEKLSAELAAEQHGWLKDKFGVSWQVWPVVLGEMLSAGTPEQIDRVWEAFLSMKKIDIAALEAAFEGIQ